MHQVTFFPNGNADTYLIELENGRRMLVDYAHRRNPDGLNADGTKDRRIDLPSALQGKLDGSDHIDVVALTHGHDDHIDRASEFFYLRHSTSYQGKGRVKIDVLWVPAAMIVDGNLEGDAEIMQREARHRLKEGQGIRVFSRPERLEEWFEREKIDLDSRQGLITDAGACAPEFTIDVDGVEFFVHSPFARRQDDGSLADLNQCSLVLQATFDVAGKRTRMLLTADAEHEALDEIVIQTRKNQNGARLEWEIAKLPHHCSYKSLSAEKGDDETTPDKNIAWLWETQGRGKVIMVSTSDPIPTGDTTQPPHVQAARYYRRRADDVDGEFVATMEHPKQSEPQPLVVAIDRVGPKVDRAASAGTTSILVASAPRAGCGDV